MTPSRVLLVALLFTRFSSPLDVAAASESAAPSADPATSSAGCPNPVIYYYHVDDFINGGVVPGLTALMGAKSLWCGTRDFATPGYGNGWDQIFEQEAAVVVPGDAHLGFVTTMDLEGNDQLWVEYISGSSGWKRVATFTGSMTNQHVLVTVPAANHSGSIRWRLHFVSDGANSDQDGLFDSHGAAVIDSLTYDSSVGGGPIQPLTEDFESEALGATYATEFRSYLNTRPGSGSVSTPMDQSEGDTPVELVFSDVECEGTTSLTTSESGPPLPGSFTAGSSTYYNLSTTATYNGIITVCISYDEGTLLVPENLLQMLHYDASLPGWVDVTTSLDTNANVVCGTVTNLSPFVIGVGSVTPVEPRPSIPSGFALYQSVPNPFNPTTNISYDVAQGGAMVSLEVFDASGRHVRTLRSGWVEAGRHEVSWNGTDEGGRVVTSGVYFCRLQAGGFIQSQKLVLLK